jgi:hypothetical protein
MLVYISACITDECTLLLVLAVCTGSPQQPINGGFDCPSPALPGSVCNATCAEGYVGNPSAICRDSGNYGEVIGTCKLAGRLPNGLLGFACFSPRSSTYPTLPVECQCTLHKRIILRLTYTLSSGLMCISQGVTRLVRWRTQDSHNSSDVICCGAHQITCMHVSHSECACLCFGCRLPQPTPCSGWRQLDMHNAPGSSRPAARTNLLRGVQGRPHRLTDGDLRSCWRVEYHVRVCIS